MGTQSDDTARLELLLADIRDAFAKTGGAEISSADLVRELIAIEGKATGATHTASNSVSPDAVPSLRRISVMSGKSDDAARLKRLLADIRDAFAKTGGAEISSADLVRELIAIEGRPWG